MKPRNDHPWTYQTWKEIKKGKKNFWDYYRFQAKQEKISSEGKLRLEWIAFYYTVGKQNVTKTASHFGISRKCFRRWVKRFARQNAHCLEELSKRPKKLREWQVSKQEEKHIITLRTQNMELGKTKLKILYKQQHGKGISSMEQTFSED
jgi:transposase